MIGQADRLEDAVDRLLLGRRASPPNRVAKTLARRLRGEQDIVFDTVWFSNTVGFWNLRPMPSSAILGLVQLGEIVAAVEIDVALVGPRLAGDDVHHRRLAGAVGADDRAHLAGLEHQRQAAQRLVAVEGNADAVEIEQR